MKKITLFNAFFIILIVFLFSTTITAQIDESFDPFGGYYSISKSAEAFLFEIKNDEELSLQAFDFDKQTYEIEQWDKESTPLTDWHWPCNDLVTADLNGDSQDEIITISYVSQNKANIILYSINNNQIVLSGKIILPTFDCQTDIEMATTRIIKGNFVPDAKEELALVYIGTDSKFHVEIYEAVGNNMQLALVAKSIPFNVASKNRDNYEYDFTGDHFDIAAVDYDQNDIDDIVMVHKLDFDATTKEFYFQMISFNNIVGDTELQKKETDLGPIVLNYGNSESYYNHGITRISRPSLAIGNIDGKDNNEIVFGHVVSNKHNYWFVAYKADLHTMHILNIDSDGIFNFFNGSNLKLIDSYNHGNHNQNKTRHHFSLNIECDDLDNDGSDEIICNGPDSLFVFDYNWNNKLEKKTGIPCYNHAFHAHRSSPFAIADVNLDTSDATWTKDIVYMKYLPNPENAFGNDMGDISIGIASYKNEKLIEEDTLLIQSKTFSKDNEFRYLLALGDFDNDGLKLGPPKLVNRVENVQEVKLVINAPPVHFDILNGIEYDLCSAFGVSSEFISFYNHMQGATNEYLLKNVADWAVSGSGGFDVNVVGAEIDGSYTGQTGKYFEDSDFKSESNVEITTIDANKTDQYYTTKINYNFFEYPILFDKNDTSHLIVEYPELLGDLWTDSKTQGARFIRTNHEIGNILSYKNFSDMRDSDSLSIKGSTITVSFQKPNEQKGYWQLNLQNTTNNTFLEKTYHNNSWDVNIRLGATGDFYGLLLGAEGKIGAKGKYDTHRLVSNATTLGTGTNIEVKLGNLNRDICEGTDCEFDYELTPYVYYSTDGALILDYITEPVAIANNGNSIAIAIDSTWWDKHYSKKPDLAFILPWRYDAEKEDIIITEEKRTRTKDFLFSPANLSSGDTLNISTRIHNYSLKDLNTTVPIQFYLGDPDNGGKLMTVLYEGVETTEILLTADLPKREELVFNVQWIIPSNVDNIIRIYSVIDPRNEIDEIHENNNKGNSVYVIHGVTGNKVNEHSIPKNYSLEQNYPNPFNPSTQIQFSLPKAEIVKVEIFDIMGQSVKTLLHEKRNVGNHKLKFDANKFASGVYFYKITAGEFIKVKKMMLLK